ncbi:hypothetical protein BYT27DRAFT_7216779 [Phlegmacium glaucopus]|nr:hypothetical protein BYT27DRAFT_7216779 [Phlegmacium glaucopus]
MLGSMRTAVQDPNTANANATEPKKLLFTSSIAVVGRYPIANPSRPVDVLEVALDLCSTDNFGYPESKWVCEEILLKVNEFNKKSSIRSNQSHFAQLCIFLRVFIGLDADYIGGYHDRGLSLSRHWSGDLNVVKKCLEPFGFQVIQGQVEGTDVSHLKKGQHRPDNSQGACKLRLAMYQWVEITRKRDPLESCNTSMLEFSLINELDMVTLSINVPIQLKAKMYHFDSATGKRENPAKQVHKCMAIMD